MRRPRLLVLADGAPLAGAEEALVIGVGGFAADRFRVRAALAGDLPRWAAATQMRVEVRMALSPDGGFAGLIDGMADTITLDPPRGTLTLEGRDLSAALMETRTQETFANQTASQIATLIAGRHGLAADVQATTTPVGRYWELEHDRLTLAAAARATTEWDLLVLLAQHEGFALWVAGGALHFRPVSSKPQTVPASALSSLRLERALTFAGDIAVTVKSWHSRAGAGCVGVARTARGAATSREYVFVAPNLTQAAAQALAERRLAELSGHELRFTAELPGELALTPRGQMRLTGTGTAFDTAFTIDEIERRMSVTHGFSQVVRGRAASG